jgi:hypothetical protein
MEGRYTYQAGLCIVIMDRETYAAAACCAIPCTNLIVASLEVDCSHGIALDFEYPFDPDNTSNEALVYVATVVTKSSP